MHHIIYKTTCLKTGKYYIGMHSTDNVDDGYLGSGRIVIRSIAKYGRSAHVREILETCENRSALRLREQAIVTEDLISDPACMNLKRGGDGMSSDDMREMWARPGHRELIASRVKEQSNRQWADPAWRAKNLQPVFHQGIKYDSLAEAKRKTGLTKYFLLRDPTFMKMPRSASK